MYVYLFAQFETDSSFLFKPKNTLVLGSHVKQNFLTIVRENMISHGEKNIILIQYVSGRL